MNTPYSYRRDYPPQELTELIEFARAGDQDALNVLIASSRVVIREWVNSSFPTGVEARVDPSDVIQEALLEASREFSSFRGQSGSEWRAWLERVVTHNLVECVRRHVDAEKRSVTREQLLAGERSSLPADDFSPSQRAIRAELRQCLRMLQSKLEPDQQRLLEMRYWEGASLAEIASSMNLSKSSAARLLRKSLQSLRRGLRKGNRADDSL